MTSERVKAFMRWTAQEGEPVKLDDIIDYDNGRLEVVPCEYLVLNEQEREEAIKESIKETLWAFNSSFLAWFTELPEEVFTALQPMCEGANDAVLAMVEKGGGLDLFVDKATEADGYGHFLAGYDGEENKVQHKGAWWYIYRE